MTNFPTLNDPADVTVLVQAVKDYVGEAVPEPQSYTPTWNAGTTNPTLGNGTLVGRYVQIGKTVHATISLTFGSTTTIGSGAYTFGLPVAAANDGIQYPVGGARVRDDSTSTYAMRTAYLVNTTTVAMAAENGVNIGHNNPWTMASGDIINISMTYEAI